MKTIVKDIEKRELIRQELIAKYAAIAEKTKDPSAADQWRPQPEYPIYVVYLMEVGGPYVVGFDSEIQAQLLVADLKSKSHVYDVTTTDSYPWEVMVDGSKKSSKQKSKPKKQ